MAITANIGEVMSDETLKNIMKSEKGLLSDKIFEKNFTESFNKSFKDLIYYLSQNHGGTLSALNNCHCNDLDMNLRVALIVLINTYEGFVKKLCQRLVDCKPDWALYQQICILLSVYVNLSRHLCPEVTYDLIHLCRQKDLFLR